MLTGTSDPALKAAARSAGIDRPAFKPLRIAELLQHIADLLRPSGVPQLF
jgi:DNA-binding response OmpR family regulator